MRAVALWGAQQPRRQVAAGSRALYAAVLVLACPSRQPEARPISDTEISPASRRATTTRAAMWAPATPSARYFTRLRRHAAHQWTLLADYLRRSGRLRRGLGYQFRPGRFIVKVFAGIEREDQHIVPHDPNERGGEIGLRLRTETWFDLSPRAFLWRTLLTVLPFRSICSQVQLGFWVTPRVSLGLEVVRSARRHTMPGEGGWLCARQRPQARGHALRWLHRDLSLRQCQRLPSAWALADVLRERTASLTRVHCWPPPR
jgi:hypothetical protein